MNSQRFSNFKLEYNNHTHSTELEQRFSIRGKQRDV